MTRMLIRSCHETLLAPRSCRSCRKEITDKYGGGTGGGRGACTPPSWIRRNKFSQHLIKAFSRRATTLALYYYCTAHDGWNVTGYQEPFCPLSYDQGVQVKAGCW